jgi:hypothetical protein
MDLDIYDNPMMLSLEDQQQAAAIFIRQKYGLAEKDFTPKPEERQQRAVVNWVFEKYDILRVRSTCQYYYRLSTSDSLVYTHAEVKDDRDFRNMVKEGYKAFGLAYTGNKIKNTVDTLKESVEREYNSIDQDVIEISKGWYWDMNSANITTRPSHECFIRLFDNSGHNVRNKVSINPDDLIVPIVKKTYNDTLRWLEETGGTLPIPKEKKAPEEYIAEGLPMLPYFEFIDTWACGNEGVYNDILKAASSVFMKKKPMGAFILTGLRRNGKSTFVKMMHMMIGRANTSSVRLAELHDPHKNLTLLGTLLNAPDEEIEGKDMSEEATADFKSMAAHEELVLPVMYSAQPQPISTDFVMFCPMNDDPEWKGNSASACAQRSLIIPFYADLSKFDNSGYDFEAETFTPAMYQDLLGVLFAFAAYYKDKKLEFSKTMENERSAVSEKSDSRVEFANLFCKWFDGYTNENLVFDEYKSWCDRNGYHYDGKRNLMFAIDKIAHGRKRTNVLIPGYDEYQRAVKFANKPGNNFFAEDFEIKAFKRTIGGILYTGKFHDEMGRTRSGESVIMYLEEWLAKKSFKKAQEEGGDDESGR